MGISVAQVLHDVKEIKDGAGNEAEKFVPKVEQKLVNLPFERANVPEPTGICPGPDVPADKNVVNHREFVSNRSHPGWPEGVMATRGRGDTPEQQGLHVRESAAGDTITVERNSPAYVLRALIAHGVCVSLICSWCPTRRRTGIAQWRQRSMAR